MKFLNLTYSRLLMILFAAFAVGLAGCGDEEEEELDPVITVDAVTVADGATVAPGDDIQLSMVARKGPDGKNLESVQITQYVNNSSTGVPVLDTVGLNLETFSFDTGVMSATLVGGETTEYRWEIIAADRDNNLASRNINFTVEAEGDTTDPDPDPVLPKSFSATFTNTNAFMATGSGENPPAVNEATADGNKGNIDLTYIYSTERMTYSFVSPFVRSDEALYGEFSIDSYPNNTMFYALGTSTARFEELKTLDKSEIAGEFEGATPYGWPGNPAGARVGGESPSNDVYGYQIDGRSGLIRVVSASGDQMNVEIITND